jgi:hypothetical protein
MKVLFDCILTSAPSTCSTTIQFVTLAEKLLEQPDTFIYWPIPEMVDDEEFQFYPQSDRIKYIRLPQYKDRMKEYNRIHPVLENLLSFNGETWDWDVLVTCRTTMVSLMRVLVVSPRQKAKGWTKRIIVIEEMMVLSMKPTVAQSDTEVQDRLTLEGYLAADEVLIPAYHEKEWVMRIARHHFSPARQKDLMGKIREVCHLNMPEKNLKTEHKFKGDRKLNIAFVGRLEKTAARLETINKILKNQFIFNGTKIHPFVCTVSDGTKSLDTDAIEVRHPKREEFWRICKEEMDLAVYFHVDVELNMSMLEPISFGVPALVKRAPWSIGMLGEDYPFFVDTEVQAHAFVNAFAKDYDKQYEVFAKWFKLWFIPIYKERVEEQGLYQHLMRFIQYKDPHAKEKLDTLAQNEIVQLIAQHGGKEFVLHDLIKKLGDTVLRTLADKIKENDRETRSLVFSTPWNEFRIALINHYGYKDGSVVTGHLVKEVG